MYGQKTLDTSTFIGIIVTIALILTAIKIEGGILPFIDAGSACIVIMGTFFVTSACFNFSDVIKSHMTILKMSFVRLEDPSEAALNAIKLAVHARNKGITSLESMVRKNDYSNFIIKSVEMLVDNSKTSDIDKLFSQEIVATAEQEAKVISILRKSAEVAPAMGLIGTLIGLIQMLGSLNDIKKIGPAMALALLTTFYGAIMAYVVFFPLASKLERNSKDNALISKIYLKAILSIGNKENPRVLENEINSFLSPSQKIYYFKHDTQS